MTSFLGIPVPYLDGAACLARWSEFDFTIDGGNTAADVRALQVCRGCAVLADCSRWFDSLPPSRKPIGVVAGRIHRPKRIRKKASA